MEQSGLSLIAAIGKNLEIGKGGRLLWRLHDDVTHFKMITMGHPVIMGRKTWESLSEKFRPLPGRMNIVVTRKTCYSARGALVASSFEAAYTMVAMCREVFVIGGGELYALALPRASRLYLTLVDAEVEADTFFPAYENDFRVIVDEPGIGDPPHRFLVLERK